MDLGWLRGIIAVLTLLTFLGICWWAYRPGNRARFEEDALMAFEPDEANEIKASRSDRQEGDQG
jgi:cytochrome c oxidase cbb3-type subunit 4